MNYEDSRNALFCEPNAYISNYKPNEKGKKIIFSEPYENVPNFYINNDFKKHEIHSEKSQSNCGNQTEKCNKSNTAAKSNIFNNIAGFNLQGLAPILSMLGGGADLSKFSGLLNAGNQGGLMNILSSLLSSGGGISNVLNMFKVDSKTSKEKREVKSTDYEISNYTRVN